MTGAPKLRRRGSKNRPAVSVNEPEWGPAMRALNEKQRRFVLALYQVKPGYGAQVRAARLAGYGTPSSSPESWAALAKRRFRAG